MRVIPQIRLIFRQKLCIIIIKGNVNIAAIISAAHMDIRIKRKDEIICLIKQ